MKDVLIIPGSSETENQKSPLLPPDFQTRPLRSALTVSNALPPQEPHIGTFMLVLVHSGSCYTIPQTEWLMDSRNLLIEVLEAECLIQCRVRTRFLVHGCRLLAASSRGRGARKLHGSLL